MSLNIFIVKLDFGDALLEEVDEVFKGQGVLSSNANSIDRGKNFQVISLI